MQAELRVPQGLVGDGGGTGQRGRERRQLGAPSAGVKGGCGTMVWAQTAGKRRDGKDKKRNWEEMVAPGRGRPWVPLARDAQQQQGWSRAKGRAMGKSRTGAAEVRRGKELKHQS